MKAPIKVGGVVAVVLVLTTVKSAGETVEEIIERYVNARGGLAKMNSVITLRVTGTVTTPEGRQSRMTYEFKRPSKVRVEEVFGTISYIRMFDGTSGWSWNSPLLTAPKSLTGYELEALEEAADFTGPLVDYKAKGHRAELLGKESSSGETFYRLKLTMSNGAVREHLIDAQSFMVVGMRRTLTSSSVHDVIYSDWREVDGVKFAYHIDTRFGGRVRKFRVEKYDINIPISDDRFTPPRESASGKDSTSARTCKHARLVTDSDDSANCHFGPRMLPTLF